MFFPADVQTHIAHILGPLPADLHAGAGHGIAQRRPESARDHDTRHVT